MPPITAPVFNSAQKLPVSIIMFPTRLEGSAEVPDTTSSLNVTQSATGIVNVVSTGPRSFEISAIAAGAVTLTLTGGSSGAQQISVSVSQAPQVPGRFEITFGEPQPK